jgi:phosphoribosylglycinamide formyltransferase 1
MSAPVRVAVLASGGGSNLQSLLDRFNAGDAGAARVELVVASRPGIGALEKAARFGVAAVVLQGRVLGTDRLGAELLRHFDSHSIDLVVLAGYLNLVPAAVVERYAGRMINTHPALLPGFGGHGLYGQKVHAAVLAAGVRVSGVTVHLVDEVYDRGAILAQWPVPVLASDTPASLAERVLQVEHLLLPAVVEAMATGSVPPSAGGASHFTGTADSLPGADQVASLIRLPGAGSASA